MALRIERYGNTRHWAVYDEQGLVVVTLYKRGAQEVRRRLEAQPLAGAEAAAQAAAVEAAEAAHVARVEAATATPCAILAATSRTVAAVQAQKAFTLAQAASPAAFRAAPTSMVARA